MEVANQSQLFPNTTREIAKYARRNIRESQDIRLVIEQVEDVKFEIPKKHAETGNFNKEAVNIIYRKELEGYIKHTIQYC